ncbi:rho GTPase-activating protein 25 [Pelodytes ibericus]
MVAAQRCAHARQPKHSGNGKDAWGAMGENRPKRNKVKLKSAVRRLRRYTGCDGAPIQLSHLDQNYRNTRSVSMMTSDQATSSSRRQIQNNLEKPAKCGWLKKQQKSFVKSWQQKYFSLKGQQLCYYKDEDDGKLQGCLFLPRSRVSEFSCSPDDAGKFIFEIIPGSSIDQNKSTPESYVLMANTQAEMEEWVKAIKRAAGSMSGAVFGQQLADTIAYEKKFGFHPVPILLEKCADFIRERGLTEEGIFRLPGQDNLVKQLKEAFDAGERPSFSRDTDVHTVASLFKLYLRELPEPVIPWCQYEGFLASEKIANTDEDKGHEELMKQIKLLPKENYNLLCFICRFFFEVQNHSSVNKMSVDNLAMVIGVNLLKPPTEDPVTLMRSAPQIQTLMTVMISQHDKFFPKTNDMPAEPVLQKKDSKKVQILRSSVGWDAAEEVVSPGEEPDKVQQRNTCDSRGSSTSDDSLSLLEEDSLSKERTESWKAVPRKRTQTLPNAKFPRSGKLPDNSVNDLKEEIFSGEFWMSPSSPNGHKPCILSSCPGHKRTLSDDFQCHRKSTYDNVPCPQGDSGHSSSSSPVNLCTKDCETEQFELQSPTSPNQCVSSPGDENKDCDNCANLVQAPTETDREKKELEEKIKSLQKENYEVWKKVMLLKEDLEKERNKRKALEIALQNVERSRDDAEKRNKHLEQENQRFIKAMSEDGSKPE